MSIVLTVSKQVSYYIQDKPFLATIIFLVNLPRIRNQIVPLTQIMAVVLQLLSTPSTPTKSSAIQLSLAAMP